MLSRLSPFSCVRRRCALSRRRSDDWTLGGPLVPSVCVYIYRERERERREVGEGEGGEEGGEGGRKRRGRG